MSLNKTVLFFAKIVTVLLSVNSPLKVCDCAEVIFPFANVVPPTEIAPFDEVTSLMIAFAPNEIFPRAEIVPEAVASPVTEIAPFWEVTSVIVDVPPMEMFPVVEIASFAVAFPFTSREANLFTEPTDFSKVTFVVFALFPIVKA